jgi:very-short-patch-repair endonuclease
MPKEWRASKSIKQAARNLRRASTPAEQKLWSALRRRQVAGLRFRRQYPIEWVVVDFCCVKKRLVVEVDGPVHLHTEEYDGARQNWLKDNRYRVLRFANAEVMDNLQGVVEAIRQAACETPDQP